MLKKIFMFLITVFTISGCYTNNFTEYYNEMIDEDTEYVMRER